MVDWLLPGTLDFPPTSKAWGAESDAPGLLAAGGDLSPARLMAAYRQGIFPWFSADQPILWWSLAPRMVLPVEEFRLTRSLRKTLRHFLRTPGCTIRVDSATAEVISACASTPREGQRGTWIVPDMQQAFVELADQGVVHSVETWVDGELVGGLYGVALGQMFYGESMFAHRTDASKLALCYLVSHCRALNIPWIDCQQQTAHLASLGARPVARDVFEAHLAQHAHGPNAGPWVYRPQHWAWLLGADAPLVLPS
ncbi:leucyl/phenylalanyl-tRNA--protein transferase [Roseateles sp. BYS180W]|uniref:Leucyl/phenylalanyl-tRNA--protein transferase n=1 Tax=Roseateles rivi TaxID=3299028 RepID=A0ABW7FXV3_9BURK